MNYIFSLNSGPIVLTSVYICSNVPHWFAEIYAKVYKQKVVFVISNYSLGQKYCRRCEVTCTMMTCFVYGVDIAAAKEQSS